MAEVVIPPDKGTPYRAMVDHWDRLWKGRYRHQTQITQSSGAVSATGITDAPAAPGYTRSFSLLVAGLFQRQPPAYENDVEDPPVALDDLSDLLTEVTSKAAGYSSVVVRPVSDGVRWQPAVLAPTRFHVEYAHRRPVKVTMWEYSNDPRYPDDKNRGLVMVETWTVAVNDDGTPNDGPGMVKTEVFETSNQGQGGATMIQAAVDVESPPAGLESHPFIVSAKNDEIRRDLFVYEWNWEESPVPLWYTLEDYIEGVARLNDQEQDDAELARRRVAMPKDIIGTEPVIRTDDGTVLANPGFNKHDNILVTTSSLNAEYGPTGGVTPIEFGDDLVQRERIERRENTILEMANINPQSIGRNVTGRTVSGDAKRADNQMTMVTITSPARRASGLLTDVVAEIGRLNATISQPSGQVGQVIVTTGFKETAQESAETARTLRDADAASTVTLVQTAHPDWAEPQVTEEVERMQAEGAANAALEF